MEYAIGVHIKTNSLRAAMYDTRGHYLHFWEKNLEGQDPELAAKEIVAGINHLLGYRKAKTEEVRGVGITLDGSIGFLKTHFKEMVEGLIGLPVFLDSTFDCVALAEMWQGAGWGKKDLLFIDYREVLDFRVIRDRKPVRGVNEFKPVTLDPAYRDNTGQILWRQLFRLIKEALPEVIIIITKHDPDDKSFWADLNRSWQCYAGEEVPVLLPAELGDDGLTLGAAALAIFR